MNVTYKLSATKPAGGILVEDCSSIYDHTQYPYRIDVFPNNSLSLWRSCDDAYHGTWMRDIRGDIRRLPSSLQWKLTTTMGFCPHLRCQLGTVSHSPAYNECPTGLCFTKLENGARSFGACCFDANGIFDSGNLFGVANKSQSVPKPIYKHSAVHLKGKDSGLFASFINANYVHDGSLIVTQCPMQTTVADALRMISQESIYLWIQMAPQSLSGRYSDCYLLHSLLPHFDQDSSSLADFENAGLFHQYSTLINTISASTGNTSVPASPTVPSVFATPAFEIHLLHMGKEMCAPHCSSSRLLMTVWFQQWTDFDAPSLTYFDTLRTVAKFAAAMPSEINRHGDDASRVAFSCLSGRGRSGTMASLVAFLRVKGTAVDHDALVDIVVRLRSQRDGMVETPSQYRALALLAGLPDPAGEADAPSVTNDQTPLSCSSHRQESPDEFAGIALGTGGRWPTLSSRQALAVAFIAGALFGAGAAACVLLCMFCRKPPRRHQPR